MLKRIKKIFGLYKNIDNVLITPYRSYATRSHIYLLGRALDDVPLKIVEDQSLLNTLKNTYKQFDSFEIPDAEIELSKPGILSLTTKTNSEGYFLFDHIIAKDLSVNADEEGWITVDLTYKNEPG